jgi:hypothetical protein
VPPSLVWMGWVSYLGEVRGRTQHDLKNRAATTKRESGIWQQKAPTGGRGFKVKQPKEKLPTRRFPAGAERLGCAPRAV